MNRIHVGMVEDVMATTNVPVSMATREGIVTNLLNIHVHPTHAEMEVGVLEIIDVSV